MWATISITLLGTAIIFGLGLLSARAASREKYSRTAANKTSVPEADKNSPNPEAMKLAGGSIKDERQLVHSGRG
jgi:hypothetical protein